MVATPQVRDLGTTATELRNGIQGQYDSIDQSIALNDQSGAAQIAGLDAKKNTAFKGIQQTASDKGVFFGGFSPDAEASYTADTYLPALAALQGTIAQTRAGLLGKKADLDAGVFNKAFDTVEGDRAVLADWNKMTAQQQFEASESDKQRAFQAQQNEQDRSAAAANARTSAAASAQKDNSGVINSIQGFLQQNAGKDGKVNPASFQKGRTQWVAAGGDAASYNATFLGYTNNTHIDDYM